MVHSFSQVPTVSIPRSQFKRDFKHSTTIDSGYLYPVLVDEILPGDSLVCSLNAFARLSTPLAPVMDGMFLDSFFFFVPWRLVWENTHKFFGAQDDPGDSTDYTIPQVTTPGAGYTAGSLFDYFGIPVGIVGLNNINALWSRSYNLIWNEWFRDQNLQDSVVVDKDNGPDTDTDYVLLRRGKRHDYFTSCLPWPQKGDDVSIPLGTSAPLYAEMDWDDVEDADNIPVIYDGPQSGTPARHAFTASGTSVFGRSNAASSTNDILADLSGATAATINALRLAFQTQKILERDARSGTRYQEIIMNHFGVKAQDHRLQRPEYLGGGSTPVNIHPVPQTSETNTTPQGTLTAFGTASIQGHGFVKSFVEHGCLVGLVSVRADLKYQEGLHRMWRRRTRLDTYHPSLANIGEQAVLNEEIFADGSSNDDDVFGYQERWSEMRYKNSMVTGQFRSSHASSLDLWHLTQEFGSLPTLNSTFIQENPPIARVVATPAEPEFLLDCYFKYNHVRPMPTYGVPGLIDHF